MSDLNTAEPALVGDDLQKTPEPEVDLVPEAVPAIEPIPEPEPMQTYHAYKNGVYQSQIMATPSQWELYAGAAGLTAGDQPAPVDPLPFARRDAISRMSLWVENFMTEITGDVPASEKASWPIKAAAAQAYLDGTATVSQTALLQVEATQTGEVVQALAEAISAKATQWAGLAATITGFRRRTQEMIMAAKTLEEIEAVLSSRQATALGLAVSLGVGA